MICRNCNYILNGNEQFCPHCGTSLSALSKEHNESDGASKPPAIFSSDKLRDDDEIKQPTNRIFLTPPDRDYEQEPEKKGKKTLVIVSLTLLLAVLCCCGYILAQKIDISPVLSAFITTQKSERADTEITSALVTTETAELDENFGLMPPDISYKPVNCYVTSKSSLPIKKGPDDSYAQVVSVSVGEQLQIIGGSLLSSSWLYVYCPSEDCYGWIKGAFLSLAESLEENTTLTSDEDETSASQPESEEMSDRTAEP